MSRIASYSQRKRAVEKGIEDAIESGLSGAFTRSAAVFADVNPNGSSALLIRAFHRRLQEVAAARAAAVATADEAKS